jgi:hypothetical protein
MNRFEPSAGYWDGLLLSRRLGRVELGAAFGFEPDRYDEGFSATLPKYSAHIRAQPLLGTVRWQTTASITQLQPANDWLSHTYVNLEQDLQVRTLSIRQDAQIDRNPDRTNWIVSRLRLRSDFRPSAQWSISANYSIRQPYAYWRTQGLFSSRRDQASIGVDYRGAGFGIGLSATSNAFESVRRSYSYSVRFLLDRIPYAGVSITLSGSYWTWGATATRYATATFSRKLGPARLRLLYSLYSVDLYRDVLTTHTGGLSAQFVLSRRLQISTDWRTTLNRDYTNNNLYLNIRLAF